jgi:hypothetical protein
MAALSSHRDVPSYFGRERGPNLTGSSRTVMVASLYALCHRYLWLLSRKAFASRASSSVSRAMGYARADSAGYDARGDHHHSTSRNAK